MSLTKQHEEALAKARAIWQDRSMRPIVPQQAACRQDPGARGPVWVSRVSLPAPPEDDVRQAVFDAIKALQGGETVKYLRPEAATVHAQWTGYRPGVSVKEPEPRISERAKYEALMGTERRDLTIFYIHGGGFIVGSPTVARPTVSKLAALSRARCFSVQYRLSPQNPFPAALLDIFIAYLSLLAPTEESFHDAVPATSIVLAGESAGLNLCLALIQLLVQVRLSNPRLRFHGQEVSPDLPAGVAGISGFFDITLSLPSDRSNLDFDVLCPTDPYHHQDRPIEPIWPADPPRGDIYCETSALCHPLVNPINTLNWIGAPSMWLASGGQERMIDGVKAIAQQTVADGVAVEFEEYRGMPHIWHVTMPRLPQAQMVMERWADACLRLRKGIYRSSAKAITFEHMEVVDLDIRNLLPLSQEQIRRIVRDHRDNRQVYVRTKTPKASM